MLSKELCPLRDICRESWRDYINDLDKDCPMRKALGQIPAEVKELIRNKVLDR